MATVTIVPSQHQFTVEGKESLLEAALRHGLALQYGCNSGNCGDCKARLISGQIEAVRHTDHAMSAADKHNGFFLLCAHTTQSDCIIETPEAGDASELPVQTFQMRVKKIESMNPHIRILTLQMQRTHRLRFFAGQSVTLRARNGQQQQLQIASCPCDEKILQFHITEAQLDDFGHLTVGSQVVINGPYNDFTPTQYGELDGMLFIAQNTGFAAAKAAIEHLLAAEWENPIYLFWLANPDCRHYLDNLCRSWSDAFENFYYFPQSIAPSAALETNVIQILADFTTVAQNQWGLFLSGIPVIHQSFPVSFAITKSTE